MIDRELEEIEKLRRAGDHEGRRALALSLVSRYPNDGKAQFAAACAQDRLGNDVEAIKHYEATLRIGVPHEVKLDLTISYASSLRNVGRNSESIAVLSDALRAHPQSPAVMAFLSLALYNSEHSEAALALMLKAALTAARVHGMDGYERALAEYQEEMEASDRVPCSPIS